METAELVRELAESTNKMFKVGIEHGRISAFHETIIFLKTEQDTIKIIDFIKSKLEEIEKRKGKE